MSKAWRDSETLESLYNVEGLNKVEIADKLGCSPATITNWMRKLDVGSTYTQTSDPVPHQITHEGYVRYGTRIDGELMRFFSHRLLAVSEYGFDEVCGNVVHHENHIPWDNRPSNITLKNSDDHGKLHREEQIGDRKKAWRNRERLKELYDNENTTIEEMANELDCGASTIYRWLEEYDLK